MARELDLPVDDARARVADRGLTVLVADDDPTTRRLLEAILAKDGWRVALAADGIEAIDRVQRVRPDLILLDVHMPGMDGIGVARHVRELARGAWLPIVFMTDTGDEEMLVRCLDAGGDDFLPKPFGMATLRAKLDAISRTRELHQVVMKQRDQLVRLHAATSREHELAERVMKSVVHRGRAVEAGAQTLVVPASLFNGDLLLTARRPIGSLHVLLGDFTGHGLQAAIGAIPVADIFRSMTAKGFAVGEIAGEINDKLMRLLPTGYFFAACLAELDFDERRITVWSGGIPDALLFRPGRGIVARFPSSHLPLAITPNQEFNRAAQIGSFEPDDRLVLYSDGLIETRDARGEMFGEERLEALLVPPLAGDEVFDRVRTAVAAFRRQTPADDDLTLAVLRCAPTTPAVQPLRPDRGGEATPLPWRVALRLEARSLEHTDPLPLLLQALAELQGFESHRATIFLVLQELYSNALDHGVLRLDSHLKNGPAGFDEYLRRRGAALRSLAGGHVEIDLIHEPLAEGGRLRIRVTDSGPGFDAAAWSAGGAHDTASHCGRGIGLVRSICESVRWSPQGNEVEAVLRWRTEPPVEPSVEPPVEQDSPTAAGP
jgi:DNA-binding response OmpR family regulator/anti-sigma regulatory factor (Ser/Thr protein kinase)